jgi:hypothetical protein
MRAHAQRITVFVMAVLFVVFLTGCNSTPTAETGPPTLEPITPAPTSTTKPPTEATEATDPTTEPTTESQGPQEPSGPAACQVSPLQIPEVEGIPPIGEADHMHGTPNAPITFIEYADFQ